MYLNFLDEESIINNLINTTKKKETIKIADSRLRSNIASGQNFASEIRLETTDSDNQKMGRVAQQQLLNENFQSEKLNSDLMSAIQLENEHHLDNVNDEHSELLE
jgi:hypothetical protein